MTGTLHDLQRQLSPPLPLFLVSIKPANPDSRGKWPLKWRERERDRESFHFCHLLKCINKVMALKYSVIGLGLELLPNLLLILVGCHYFVPGSQVHNCPASEHYCTYPFSALITLH